MAGATAVTKIKAGKISKAAAGPLGNGHITRPYGGLFYWTRNTETVHPSFRDIDFASRLA